MMYQFTSLFTRGLVARRLVKGSTRGLVARRLVNALCEGFYRELNDVSTRGLVARRLVNGFTKGLVARRLAKALCEGVYKGDNNDPSCNRLSSRNLTKLRTGKHYLHHVNTQQ